MKSQYRKVKKYLSLLKDSMWRNITKTQNISFCPCGYKKNNTPPAPESFEPIPYGGTWGSGVDSHAWFHFRLDSVNENTYLYVQTDKNGWDANNPQFIIYVNGKQKQGLDTNHREVYAGDIETPADIYLYAYVGMACETRRYLSIPAKNIPRCTGFITISFTPSRCSIISTPRAPSTPTYFISFTKPCQGLSFTT